MQRLLGHLLQRNEHAVQLCLAVFDWANDYDHVVDKDEVAKSPEQALHDAMWTMAVVIPQNPFYQAHVAELSVTLANGISSWRVSNALQASDSIDTLMVAHVLRWKLIDFFLHCARLIGGRAWADEQAPGFWLAMTQDHTFSQFMAEIKGA